MDPHTLPQLTGGLFLTDGGLETSLIFEQGIDLPEFAAFVLLDEEPGRAALRSYYLPFLALAVERDAGFVLDTPTWRANPDWGAKLGYDVAALTALDRDSVAFAAELRASVDSTQPIVLNGVVGPRGDGYVADKPMSADDAERYHAPQLQAFAEAGAEMASAITMTYADEAIGIVRAGVAAGLPVVVSFTLGTDGRLPNEQTLRGAIEQVDAATDDAAAYFMVNCAHPTHFAGVLAEEGPWRLRLRGIRGNASRMSHAELDEAPGLDSGDPVDFGAQNRALLELLPQIAVLGGCCGTDERHLAEICSACFV